MTPLITPSASHWYRYVNDEWAAFYEVPKADGKGMRRTTLADARKVKDVVPSCTNVLSIIAKPQLESWKIAQGILSSLTLPRKPDEPLDAYALRVVDDMDKQSEAARSFGSDLHKAIEDELRFRHMGEYSYKSVPEIEPFMVPVRAWLKENVEFVHDTEAIVGNRELAVAGKLDLDCNLKGWDRTICDFKTQSVKNGKPTFYPEFPIQLSVYERCRREQFKLEPMAIASVIIDSTAPGGIHVQVWDDPQPYFDLFEHAYQLWCYQKEFNPRNPHF